MRKLAPFLFVILVACAGAQTVPQKIFVAQSNLNSALTLVAAYVQQPTCTAVVTVKCAEPSIKAEMKRLAAKAGDAFAAVRMGRGVVTEHELSLRLSALAGATSELIGFLVKEGLIK